MYSTEVYFAVGGGLTKVGMSMDVERRVAEHRRESGIDLLLIYVEPGDRPCTSSWSHSRCVASGFAVR